MAEDFKGRIGRRRLRSQLVLVGDQGGAQRIYLFDRRGIYLLDTGSESVVGKPYPRLAFDRLEVEALWRGETVCSVRFQDEGGH